jgi:hypothetical protein
VSGLSIDVCGNLKDAVIFTNDDLKMFLRENEGKSKWWLGWRAPDWVIAVW